MKNISKKLIVIILTLAFVTCGGAFSFGYETSAAPDEQESYDTEEINEEDSSAENEADEVSEEPEEALNEEAGAEAFEEEPEGTVSIKEDSAESECPLYVNEVCADENKNGALHRYNPGEKEYYDWVEIYNKSDEPVNASAYYITDKKKKQPKRYQLPDVEVPAHGYLIIYCGKEPSDKKSGEYFSGFGVSSKGDESVYLTDGENVLNQIDVKFSATNKTMARYPDGGDRVTLTTATPGKANGYSVSAPEFSHESGFYDPFTLTISSYDGATIYYTTDGSTPTAKSKKYTGAIQVKNVSSNKNVYSARKDISTLYKKSLLKKYHMMSWYMQPPKKKVDKITRIKAICIDSNGKKSPVVSMVYFVGLGSKAAYKNVNIVSIQASDSDLWSKKNGIYVLGKKYTGKTNNKIAGTAKMAMRFKGNYTSKRTISGTVHYFENSGSEAVCENVKMKLKGHLSRAMPQKSWNIKGDLNSFTLEIDGLDAAYKLKDPTASLITDGMNFEHSSFTPTQVFLNGEYWGLYYKGDRLFSKSNYNEKYGVDKSTVAIIKQGKLNEGKKKDLKQYKALLKYIKNHDMRVGKNYKYVAKRMNIDSMIDYYCIEVYAANIDWRPNWNYGVWRSSQYDNGRWNYVLWDLNNSHCFEDKSKNMMQFTFSVDPYFKSMYRNADFRSKFTKRFNQLSKTNFSPSYAKKQLTSVYKAGRSATSANMKRWYEGRKSVKSYDKKYKKIKSFLNTRAKTCKKHIRAVNKQKKYTASGTSGITARLTKTSYKADGKEKKPKAKVKKTNGTVLKEGVDYKLVYSNNVKRGKATVKIKMIGGFRGTITKTFTIK